LRTPENIRLLQQAIACFDDAQAYRQLFILLQPSLLQFATSITKSKQLSEEIVSDVFIKIWQKRQQLDKIENLPYYLFTAVKNHAINELQKQKKNLSLALDEVTVQFRSLYYDPEQKLITSEIIRLIQLSISQLPPRCQLIFKLIKEDGLKYKEVAELLHLSVKTIENQMTLAIKKIGASIGSESRLDSHHLVDFLSKN
jgi:RNA polymerase sigma-19 factor, ECF subfamily